MWKFSDAVNRNNYIFFGISTHTDNSDVNVRQDFIFEAFYYYVFIQEQADIIHQTLIIS